MSLVSRITALAQSIGADIKSLQAQITALGEGHGGSPDPLDLSASDPATPAADTVRIFGRKFSGRMLPAFKEPSGNAAIMQPSLARNKVAYVQPNGGSTVIGAVGLALAATGTATAAGISTTNVHTSLRRIDYLVTTASATAVAGFRSASAQFFRGQSKGLGGFHFVCRWGPATGVSTPTKRAWVGLRSATAAPTDVQPSSLVNAIGMGWDSGDSNIQIMHNGASGTATKIDLGASFPIPTTDRTNVYEVALFCPPNGSYVDWEVNDLNPTNPVSVTGRITTNLPAATTLLAPVGYCSAGGTSSVIGISLVSLYIETNI